MKKLVTAILIFFFSILCTSDIFAQAMKVVASISPVGDMVKEVGGDLVDVRVLLPPGASPHVFDATPGMARDLSEARLFFEIGADWSSGLKGSFRHRGKRSGLLSFQMA